jgi:glycosyltransferase involved in cell wall biosynthesis
VTAPTVIVVPCFNEAARLDTGRFTSFLSRPGASFLCVDDGSRDETARVLEELASQSAGRLRVLRLPANRGKANAVRAGMRQAIEAGAARVGYWDADLATPLEEIPRFEAVLEAHRAVIGVLGSRVRMLGTAIDRSAARHYTGRVFATIASMVLRLAVYDTQCGAKLFRSGPVLRAALDAPFRSRWAFDVELIARLDRASRAAGGPPAGELLVELPLQVWQDVGGSKLSPPAMVRATLELLAVRRNAGRDVRLPIDQVVSTSS